jgi:hypothetical protein
MALIQTRRGFLGGIAAAGAAGLIRAPRAETADSTDWRFLDEVKRELKA